MAWYVKIINVDESAKPNGIVNFTKIVLVEYANIGNVIETVYVENMNQDQYVIKLIQQIFVFHVVPGENIVKDVLQMKTATLKTKKYVY